MQRLAQMFASEREQLESRWSGGGDVSTEGYGTACADTAPSSGCSPRSRTAVLRGRRHSHRAMRRSCMPLGQAVTRGTRTRCANTRGVAHTGRVVLSVMPDQHRLIELSAAALQLGLIPRSSAASSLLQRRFTDGGHSALTPPAALPQGRAHGQVAIAAGARCFAASSFAAWSPLPREARLSGTTSRGGHPASRRCQIARYLAPRSRPAASRSKGKAVT